MPHADFVHLRVHSSYSLSEGAIKADKIAALARDAAMPAVAITDTGNLFGALEFSQACPAKGIQPILGLQVNLARPDPRLPPDPVVLLAQDAATAEARRSRTSEQAGAILGEAGAEMPDGHDERLAALDRLLAETRDPALERRILDLYVAMSEAAFVLPPVLPS